MENLKTSTKKKTGYQVFFSRRYLELNSIHPTTTPPLTFTELSKYISQEWNQLSNDQKLDFHTLSSSVDNGITNNDCLEVYEETPTTTLPPITSRREELMQMRVKPDLYKLCEEYKLTKTGNKSMIVDKILEREQELVKDGVKNKDNSNEKDEKDEIEIVDSKENEEKEIFICLKQHLYNKLRTKNRLLSSQNPNPLFSSDPLVINHSKIRRLHIPRLHINTVPFQPSSLSILLQEAVNDSVQNNHSGNPGFSKTVVRRLEKGGIDHINNINQIDHIDHIDPTDQIGCDHDEHDEHGIYVGLIEEEDGIVGIVGIKKKKILPEEEELVEDPEGGDEDPDDPEGGDPEDEDPENEEDNDDPDNEDDDLGELEDPEDVPIEDDDLEMIPETEDVFM